MPANRARAIAYGQNVFPVANHTFASGFGVDIFAEDEVFEPFVVHVVEHLMVNIRGQIHGVAGAYGKSVFSYENFAAAADDIIRLFGLRVFVVVGGFAPLKSVFDNALNVV